jgi:chaperonin cofactor prefoldin
MTIEIGVLIAMGGLFLSYLTYQFNKQKETKTDTRQDAEIKAQLSYISKGVDEIRLDQKASDRKIGELSIQVAKIDESNKSLHKRVDKLEGKGDA